MARFAQRSALMALRDDAEFKADAARIGFDHPTSADEIEKFVKLCAAAPPAVIGRLTAIINPINEPASCRDVRRAARIIIESDEEVDVSFRS